MAKNQIFAAQTDRLQRIRHIFRRDVRHYEEKCLTLHVARADIARLPFRLNQQ